MVGIVLISALLEPPFRPGPVDVDGRNTGSTRIGFPWLRRLTGLMFAVASK